MAKPAMDLSVFANPDFDRGAGRGREFLWLCVRSLLFLRSFTPCYSLRRAALRAFGADVGRGVIVKPGAKITFPWKLSIGDHCWIGEETWIHNLGPVTIGSHACLSQRSFLCTGNHDWADPHFALKTQPIDVGNGVWICANVFIGPGVTVGDNTVLTAGSVATDSLPSGMICSGNPCKPVRARRMNTE
jgi:putative colanic acid biosynthesis acetyltransferase WcaF